MTKKKLRWPEDYQANWERGVPPGELTTPPKKEPVDYSFVCGECGQEVKPVVSSEGLKIYAPCNHPTPSSVENNPSEVVNKVVNSSPVAKELEKCDECGTDYPTKEMRPFTKEVTLCRGCFANLCDDQLGSDTTKDPTDGYRKLTRKEMKERIEAYKEEVQKLDPQPAPAEEVMYCPECGNGLMPGVTVCSLCHPPAEEWEKEFDEKYPSGEFTYEIPEAAEEKQKEVKSFIRTLLAEKEGETLQQLEGWAKNEFYTGLQAGCRFCGKDLCECERNENRMKRFRVLLSHLLNKEVEKP